MQKNKRIILKGTTTNVISQINDESLDFVYIDGDHTLKGISIDLINTWDKVKKGGFIAGDDFCPSIWQHSINYEPTFVFPFAVYFAEAMNTTIFALPYNQFLISTEQNGFNFINLSDKNYQSLNALNQFNTKLNFKSLIVTTFPKLYKLIKN